jgi:hypothetical protein
MALQAAPLMSKTVSGFIGLRQHIYLPTYLRFICPMEHMTKWSECINQTEPVAQTIQHYTVSYGVDEISINILTGKSHT